jgi:hypothetical protein
MSSIDDRIMSERERLTSDGEPLFTVHRSVRLDGSGPGLIHNIPEQAVRLCDVDRESDAVIDIYSNGYTVRFEE